MAEKTAATVAEVGPDATEKIDLGELSQSLTGFDQVAIRLRFGTRLEDLMEDTMTFMYALYFVHLRRQGAKDADAYSQAMSLPLSQISEVFKGADADDEDEGPTAVEDRDKEFADFIVGTGMKYTMDEYLALTIQQRAFIIDAVNKSR